MSPLLPSDFWTSSSSCSSTKPAPGRVSLFGISCPLAHRDQTWLFWTQVIKSPLLTPNVWQHPMSRLSIWTEGVGVGALHPRQALYSHSPRGNKMLDRQVGMLTAHHQATDVCTLCPIKDFPLWKDLGPIQQCIWHTCHSDFHTKERFRKERAHTQTFSCYPLGVTLHWLCSVNCNHHCLFRDKAWQNLRMQQCWVASN